VDKIKLIDKAEHLKVSMVVKAVHREEHLREECHQWVELLVEECQVA